MSGLAGNTIGGDEMCERCHALRASMKAEREEWAMEREMMYRMIEALQRQQQYRAPARVTTTPRVGHD
jgi:GTP-dependent phosphoenolpyruvate carboxykinase